MLGDVMSSNPRSQNGTLRRQNRARIRAAELPCHICGKPIHYDEPSDSSHPLSFVIDEIIPVSRWKEYGYDSPRHVAEDPNNLAPAHWICNARKSNKINYCPHATRATGTIEQDGNW
jgi:5-methylcytosine-specific restriction endonuclease McrA